MSKDMKSIHPNKQRGAILVLSILLLIVLTIISISSITTTVLQEKSTHNVFNTQLAFQASETALRSAEEFIRSTPSRPPAHSSCTQNCDIVWREDLIGETYGNGTFTNNWWAATNKVTNDNWWTSIGHSIPNATANDGTPITVNVSDVASQPRFIAEELAFIPDDLNPNTRATGRGLAFYRITSRGTGGEATVAGVNPAQVYLQSIFGKRFY